MTFIVKFSVDNAAFEGNREETSRILRTIADKVEQGRNEGKIQDINGNTIGEFYHIGVE